MMMVATFIGCSNKSINQFKTHLYSAMSHVKRIRGARWQGGVGRVFSVHCKQCQVCQW